MVQLVVLQAVKNKVLGALHNEIALKNRAKLVNIHSGYPPTAREHQQEFTYHSLENFQC